MLAATSPQGGVAAGARARESESNLSPFHCNHKRTCHIKRHYVSTARFGERAGEGWGRDGDAVQQRENRTLLSEREKRRESFPFCQRYIITTVRAVSYFSPFVFNLAVSASCILFAAAAAPPTRTMPIHFCPRPMRDLRLSCSSSHFRRGVKLVLQ